MMSPISDKLGNSSKVALTANDPRDIFILSALLHRAILKPCDMSWQQQKRQFVLTGYRYTWEKDSSPIALPCDGMPHQNDPQKSLPEVPLDLENCPTVPVGFHFGTVSRVQSRGIDQSDMTALSLMAILYEEHSKQSHFTLLFEGNKALSLWSEIIQVSLKDI